MDFIEFTNLFVCCPDGGQTGGLGRHNINTNPEISAELSDAWSDKFHDLIVDISICKCRTNNRQRNILGTDSLCRLSVQVDSYYPRHLDIIGLIQKLLHELRAALTHSHCPECTVTGMAVRAKNHPASACQHLAGILVNHCLVGRYIYSSVFFRAGQAKHVVILIDCSAHCAQRVVTVGKYIWDRKSLQSGSPCCLDDSYKCNVMRCQLVKLNLKLLHISGGIVFLKDPISHCLLRKLLWQSFLPGSRLYFLCVLHNLFSVQEIDAPVIYSQGLPCLSAV